MMILIACAVYDWVAQSYLWLRGQILYGGDQYTFGVLTVLDAHDL